jgi:hypothetical protein
MSPSRRQVLAGLVAAGVLGCGPRSAPVPLALERPVRLGWRWVAGQSLTYRVRTTHRGPGHRTVRSERWSYRVRSVDPAGIATLDGVLVGIGGEVNGSPAPEASLDRHRAEGGRVRLRIGTDGRLHLAAGTGCAAVGPASAVCFGDQLPHRLLAVPLPRRPVVARDRWPDPDLAALIAALLPDETPTRVDSTLDLWHLTGDPDTPRLLLGTDLVVRGAAGAQIRAAGAVTWDALQGVLHERTLTCRLVGAALPDELHIITTRVA